jgi:enolase
MLAMDAAASELFENGKYEFKGIGISKTTDEMVKFYEKLVKDFPIYSIEDGMGEQDPEGWKALTAALGSKIQIVADDLAVTNPSIIAGIIANKQANSILIKPNQIGTLTETMQAADMAHRAGFTSFFSHRSGETEDAALADLVVAAGGVQIKTGSASRSERMAKYNQLMRIEEELGTAARYVGTSLIKK